MAGVVVPSTDTAHYNLQQSINDLTALITSVEGNGNYVQGFELRKTQARLQAELVTSLVASGNLSAANVLSVMTYKSNVQPGGDQG